jgi:hypothetical protein
MHTNISHVKKNRGYLLLTVLVYATIFFILIGSFIGYTLTQSKVIAQKLQLEQAGQIAEAGLNYYKWYLAHHPNDTTNGTGGPGPYVGVYKDPEGGSIGEYSLQIASTTYCGDVASITVTSTGHTYSDPTIIRTMSARYARPTVSEYAFILNSNVWAGPDRVITGPYHSNGGVRMDGTNSSVVTSGQGTWSCTSTFGCSPTQNKNGVFTTANGVSSLFAFPSAPINFAGITVDLSSIQNKAQHNGGIYVPASGTFGYRVKFNGNSTVSVYKVTQTYTNSGSYDGSTFATERNIIQTDSLVGTYTISNKCPVIYVEDKVWLEGSLNQKVTLAAADVDSPGVNPGIILNGNITYTSSTTAGLLAIAEQDILVGIAVPDDMRTDGIFIAQNGKFTRNYYRSSDLPNPSGPLDFQPYYQRNSHTINGTIVSNLGGGTQWTSGGVFVSGFHNRFNSYDRNLVLDPPPLVPATSDVYRFTDWRDKN